MALVRIRMKVVLNIWVRVEVIRFKIRIKVRFRVLAFWLRLRLG